MASAASLKIFLLTGGNPPRNSKTNNAGIKVGGIGPPHPPGVGAYGCDELSRPYMCRTCVKPIHVAYFVV
jgi:hypothetical protein